MNFISTSSDYQPLESSGLVIVNDNDKGRCYEALRDYNIGDVIYTEQALVYGSYNDDYDDDDDIDEVNISILMEAYSKRIKNFKDNVRSILDEICSLEKVQSLDTARCFLQLLGLIQLLNEGKLTDQKMISTLELLSSMTACNVDECLQDIRNLKKAFPKLIHSSISDSEASRYLAILNTNQLELEQFGGSGLFVATSVFEHSCDCNCSYTTHENTLYMTAIKEIKKGERVSIDYGNNYYHCTTERQQGLYETYRFICNCQKCLGPDRSRPFKCTDCKNCFFYPIGGVTNENISPSDFTPCLMCNKQQEIEYISQCLASEDEIMTNPPTTYEEIISSQSFLGEGHYLLFFALNDLAMAVCSDARMSNKNAGEKFREGLRIMTEVVRIFCNQVTGVHHEKVLYFDKLAQIALAANEYELCKEYFQEAYVQAMLAVGRETPLTKKLYHLATNTPRSVLELQQQY